MRKVVLLIILLVGPFVRIFAVPVVPDTIAIDEVVVESTGLRDLSTGSHTVTTDSLILQHYQAQSLADLLSGQTAISVQMYGPGGLAGISLRGGGTRHTAVLWEGFNLQNPMNAGLNFSSIPVCLIDKLTIQYGGSGTLIGNGATTGSIHLNNSLRLNQGTSLSLSSLAGSYLTFNQSAKFIRSGERFATATRMFYENSRNDFPYRAAGQVSSKLRHAAYQGYGLMQQNAWRTGPNSIIRNDIWVQRFDKLIPSLISDTREGNTSQTDENLRWALNFDKSLPNINIKLRTGLFDDRILFYDPDVRSSLVHNESLQSINETEVGYKLSSHHFFYGGVGYIFETARVDDYSHNPTRQRGSVFLSYRNIAFSDRWHTTFTVRQEVVESKMLPIVYSGGTDLIIFQGLHIKFNASKTYTLPTFNDLFWKEDAFAEGNPDLKPESGYSAEGGIMFYLTKGCISLSQEITTYVMENNNWIVWTPGKVNNLPKWKPENFDMGRSRGIEFNGSINFKEDRLTHKLNYFYSYTHASLSVMNTNTGERTMNEMLYIPRNKLNINYYLLYKKYCFIASFCFIDSRKTDAVNTLPAYYIVDVSARRDMQIGHQNMEVFMKVNNITGINYQALSGYPMPPRNYCIGLTFNMKK